VNYVTKFTKTDFTRVGIFPSLIIFPTVIINLTTGELDAILTAGTPGLPSIVVDSKHGNDVKNGENV
jgi:hypothetical protein